MKEEGSAAGGVDGCPHEAPVSVFVVAEDAAVFRVGCLGESRAWKEGAWAGQRLGLCDAPAALPSSLKGAHALSSSYGEVGGPPLSS